MNQTDSSGTKDSLLCGHLKAVRLPTKLRKDKDEGRKLNARSLESSCSPQGLVNAISTASQLRLQKNAYSSACKQFAPPPTSPTEKSMHDAAMQGAQCTSSVSTYCSYCRKEYGSLMGTEIKSRKVYTRKSAARPAIDPESCKALCAHKGFLENE